MKKFVRDILGVTLLEVMLVLAIAAMIIIMSVRFYQSASTNQQVNGLIQFVQGVTAAADSLAQGTGSYTSVNPADLTNIMPSQNMNLPWGTVAQWTAGSETTFTLTLPSTPTATCIQFISRMAANNKYTVPAGCASVAYDNTK